MANASAASGYFKKKVDRLKALLKKFVAFNSKPTYDDFPELVTIMMWVRCVLGLGYGISMGRSLTYGSVGLLFGLNAICLIPMAYCNLYLQADTDSYGAKLLFGGVHNSIAALMLVWIYYYTCHFSDQEQQMIALLVNSNMTASTTAADMTAEGMIDPSTQEVFDQNVDAAPPSEISASASAASASAEAAAKLQQEAMTATMDESEF